jgi:hypothetical protein
MDRYGKLTGPFLKLYLLPSKILLFHFYYEKSSSSVVLFRDKRNYPCSFFFACCQGVVYADDVNLLGDDIETIKKDAQTIIDAGKEVGLEVNTEKIKYMLLSHHQMQGKIMT